MKKRMSGNDKKNLSAILIIILTFSAIAYIIFFKKDAETHKANPYNLNDNWKGDPYSGIAHLKPVFGKKYMISTANKLASQAGAKILAKDGNAIDALIAAQMVLNVVEPQSSGIGGGGFLLYFDTRNKKTHFYNGRETAPHNIKNNVFLDKDGNPRRFEDALQGGLSVGTPGLLKMLKLTHDKYGKLPWKDLFTSAIKIASEGFPIDVRIHETAKKVRYLKNFDNLANLYLKEDRTPKDIGTTIYNPKLAKTFELIANEGIKTFYEGEIAQNIVKTVQNSSKNPGFLKESDLKTYQVKESEPVCASYRQKYKICSAPLPSSGGITLLQILGILENFDLPSMQPSSTRVIHLITEATKLAYVDRNHYLADTPNVPVSQMLDKKYLKSRSKMIQADNIISNIKPGKFKTNFNYTLNKRDKERPSTTHLSIIDKYGNAASMTSSIEYTFGSGLMVDGFILNNQLTDFSFLPEINGKPVANRIEPGKQPRSSMTPTLVFDNDDNLLMVIGSPGGPRIIQFVLKTIIAHLDWGVNIQKAISLPNSIALQDIVELEKRTNLKNIKNDIANIGHQVRVTDITSGINAVTITDDDLIGGADPRRWGSAIGE